MTETREYKIVSHFFDKCLMFYIDCSLFSQMRADFGVTETYISFNDECTCGKILPQKYDLNGVNDKNELEEQIKKFSSTTGKFKDCVHINSKWQKKKLLLTITYKAKDFIPEYINRIHVSAKINPRKLFSICSNNFVEWINQSEKYSKRKIKNEPKLYITMNELKKNVNRDIFKSIKKLLS